MASKTEKVRLRKDPVVKVTSIGRYPSLRNKHARRRAGKKYYHGQGRP